MHNATTLILCLTLSIVCFGALEPPKPSRYTIKVTPFKTDPNRNVDILKYFDDYQNGVFRMDWTMKVDANSLVTQFFYFGRTKSGYIVYDPALGKEPCDMVPNTVVNATNFGFLQRAYRDVVYDGTTKAKSNGEECHLWVRKEIGQTISELVSVATSAPIESWLDGNLDNIYSEYSTSALEEKMFKLPVNPSECKKSENKK